MLLQCSVCLERSNSNAKESLKPHKIPKYPWQVVATDLFCFDNNDYVVIVDYHSMFFVVHKLNGTKRQSIITKCIFSSCGIQETVVSDNGPKYAEQEFSDFVREWDSF